MNIYSVMLSHILLLVFFYELHELQITFKTFLQAKQILEQLLPYKLQSGEP